jgi:hypothetical protein
MPYYFFAASGLTVNGKFIQNLDIGGNGVSVSADSTSVDVKGFTVTQGALNISSPNEFVINSTTAVLSAVGANPTVVQGIFSGGSSGQMTFENNVTVGNLIVFISCGVTTVPPGFTEKFSTPDQNGVVVAMEMIASSSAPPIVTTGRSGGYLFELSNVDDSIYAGGNLTKGSGTLVSAVVDIPAGLQSLALCYFSADNSAPSAPYMPANATLFGPGGYNSSALLFEETLVENENLTFSANSSDANYFLSAVYQQSINSAELTI